MDQLGPELRMRAALLVGLASLLFVSEAAADPAADLATSLVETRARVETLTDQLEGEKRSRAERSRALAARVADLEAELGREKLRLSQLDDAVARKKAELEAARADDEALVPVFRAAVGLLSPVVAASLPFQRDARLKALAALEAQLDEGLLAPRDAVARLWAFVEDELRLTNDTGLYREPLRIDGTETLAEVVRLGTTAMYFRTTDDRVGTVRRVGREWRTSTLGDPEEKRRVLGLFDAYKKQIRVGWFTLPSALPEGGG